eukprot:gene8090-biopygen3289
MEKIISERPVAATDVAVLAVVAGEVHETAAPAHAVGDDRAAARLCAAARAGTVQRPVALHFACRPDVVGLRDGPGGWELPARRAEMQFPAQRPGTADAAEPRALAGPPRDAVLRPVRPTDVPLKRNALAVRHAPLRALSRIRRGGAGGEQEIMPLLPADAGRLVDDPGRDRTSAYLPVHATLGKLIHHRLRGEPHLLHLPAFLGGAGARGLPAAVEEAARAVEGHG